MLTAVSFIIAKMWKPSRCSPVGAGINKLWSTLTKEYYSPLKQNELSNHKKTWHNFKCIWLSDRSRSEKATVPTIWHSGESHREYEDQTMEQKDRCSPWVTGRKGRLHWKQKFLGWQNPPRILWWCNTGHCSFIQTHGMYNIGTTAAAFQEVRSGICQAQSRTIPRTDTASFPEYSISQSNYWARFLAVKRSPLLRETVRPWWMR